MKVLSLYRFNLKHTKQIEELVDYKHVAKGDIENADVEEAEIIIGNLPLPLLVHAKKLKWLQLYSAGSDTYKKELLPNDCILSNASGTFGLTINEHLIMTTIMLMRTMQGYVKKQMEHKWEPIHHNRMINKSTFVIVGCGDLGQRYAKSVQFFGGYTIGIKRRSVDSLDGFDEVYTLEELDNVLARADVLCLTIPKNKDSDLLINKERLSLLKSDCLLLNVGRGNSIDEDALYDALENETIAGAHLDVFEQEPLEFNHKLWDAKNLIITPHVSGTFANAQTRELFEALALDNLKRYLSKDKLRNIVDFESGYRKDVD